MFARISTFKRSLENLDEGIVLLRESILPRLDKQPGFDGVMVMAAAPTGSPTPSPSGRARRT